MIHMKGDKEMSFFTVEDFKRFQKSVAEWRDAAELDADDSLVADAPPYTRTAALISDKLVDGVGEVMKTHMREFEDLVIAAGLSKENLPKVLRCAVLDAALSIAASHIGFAVSGDPKQAQEVMQYFVECLQSRVAIDLDLRAKFNRLVEAVKERAADRDEPVPDKPLMN
jgi:hypothetical protein